MNIFANLTLENGRVISQYRGKKDEQKKVYLGRPVGFVDRAVRLGVDGILVVDLEGKEQARLPELRAAAGHAKLWWAGQLHDLPTLRRLLDGGADALILGHQAEPIMEAALKECGAEKIIAGIQSHDPDAALEAAEKLAQKGFTQILVRDLNAEGALFHPNFDLIEKSKYFTGARIHAAGGVSSLYDLELLNKAGAETAIIGRALWENEINPHEFKRQTGF